MHPVNLGDFFQALVNSHKSGHKAGSVHISVEKHIFLNAGYSEELETGLRSIFEEFLGYRSPGEDSLVEVKPSGPEILTVISISAQVSGDQQQSKGDARKFFAAVSDLDEVGVRAVIDNPTTGKSNLSIYTPVLKTGDYQLFRKGIVQMFRVSEDVLDRKERSIHALVELNGLPEGFVEQDAVNANLYFAFEKEEESSKVNVQRQKLDELKSANSHGKSVLIADDSLFVHFFLGSLLCDMGLRIVDFAGNGREAVNLYEKNTPALVTMDCTMPVLSGLDAADEIWKKNKSAKIIFITGLGDHPMIRQRIMEIGPSGCYEILSKPIDEAELRQAVTSILPLP